VIVPLAGGLGFGSFNRVRARWNDDPRAWAVTQHGVIGRSAIIGAIGLSWPIASEVLRFGGRRQGGRRMWQDLEGARRGADLVGGNPQVVRSGR
jgi:hypothetical protein